MDGIERAVRVQPDNHRLLPQHVKRALAYMNANIAERVTLAGLASACAVPERTLLRQFQRFIGLPPLTYLRRLRLNAVRNELATAQSNDDISDVAVRCGFSHLGRFAKEYRRLFGEAPSATRQRVHEREAGDALAKNGGASCAGDDPPSSFPTVGRERPSLLILPWRSETLQEDLEARDLTERLAATLSRIRVASVALAHPSHRPSIKAPQPRNAGTQYCLLGRLTRRDQRTRVIIRLVDVAADRHIWGDSFDGSVNDPFELQDRVVDGALCGIVSNIFRAEIERAHDKDPRDLAARDLAMRALMLVLRADASGARDAMPILDRAIELDPASALPVALLACCHAQTAIYFGTSTPAAARKTALRLSARAGMLDGQDSLVMTARATAASMSLELDEGDALVTRALAMDPSSSWAWERRGHIGNNAAERDPDGVIADFSRALQLRAPGMPRSYCLVGIAGAHYTAGQPVEAERWIRRAVAENPQATCPYLRQTSYALTMGDQTALMAAVERLRRARPDITVSLIAASFPGAPPQWLDAVARAGVPL